MKPLRVLLVGRGHPETGGIAAFLQGLEHSGCADFDAELLNLTRHDDMGSGGSLSIGNIRRTVLDTWAVFRAAGSVDVVHIHSALAPTSTLLRAGLLVAAARSRRRPVVVHAHGGRLVDFAATTSRRRLIRLCLRGATHLIGVSGGVAGVLERELGADRVTLVPNGVDADRFSPASDRSNGPTQVLYVGHLSERKGVLDLLAASAFASAEGADHELVLVGGRPDEGDDEYARVLEAIENGGGVAQVIGAVDYADMPGIYRAADVFCLPSWWEAMPLSILEAMASGNPVLATDVGDVDQLVTSETGVIVDAQCRDELGRALVTMLRDDELRSTMGDAGRRRALDHFSLTRTHERIAEIYGRVKR